MTIYTPFIRSPYNYDVEAASNETAYTETMPSLTVQSQTEDSDLNVMMLRFGVTGKMPEDVHLPQYGDYTDVGDFHSAMRAIQSASENFMKFPADIRARFDNDPQNFLDFVDNPANIEQTKKWFPKENFDAERSVRSGTAPANATGAAAGAAAPQRDAGNAGAAGDTKPA